MYFTAIIITALIGFVGSNVSSDLEAESPIACQGVVVRLPHSVEEVVILCLKEQGVKTPEELPDYKKACYGKCIFTRSDVIGKNGVPNNEKMAEIIYDTFPNGTGAAYVEAVRKCNGNFSHKIKTFETTCDSYKQVSHCIVDNYVKLCSRKAKSSPL